MHDHAASTEAFCQCPYAERAAYRDFMGWDMPWYSAQDSAGALLDMTVYGRQETWEDSPPGWPQPFGTSGEQFRANGRPTAQ